MTHFDSQDCINNFIQRAGALATQVGYLWVQARESGSQDEGYYHKQFKYLNAVIQGVCTYTYGATDNLLTEAEMDTAYEVVTLINDLCDNSYLLNDTL